MVTPARLDLSSAGGRYRLSALVGRGGMAEVYAGYYMGAAGFERPVCVKHVLPDDGSDHHFRELFMREVHLAGQLCHSNLVQVFDCIADDDAGRLGLVMELVDGMDLKTLIRCLAQRDQLLPQGLVAYVAGQALAGLCYAHERRIVHRDISPHNILVSRQGEVKLADFGVAKAMNTYASQTGNVRGKLAYMSPEQAGGREVDYRTDLYSLGLVLYELLTGVRFFGRSPRWSLLYEVVKAEQPRLSGVEQPLGYVVERLLAPEASARFQSAEQALRALPAWDVVGPLGARELSRVVVELAGEPIPIEPFESAATEPREQHLERLLTPSLPKTISEDTPPELELYELEEIVEDDDRSTTPTPSPASRRGLPATMELGAIVSTETWAEVRQERRRRLVTMAVVIVVFALVALVFGAIFGVWLRSVLLT